MSLEEPLGLLVCFGCGRSAHAPTRLPISARRDGRWRRGRTGPAGRNRPCAADFDDRVVENELKLTAEQKAKLAALTARWTLEWNFAQVWER
jgi:hypothetical protein